MNKTLYLDCSSGISGDMFVGALLDLGVDEQKLREALKSLSVSGFEVKISRKKKAGLDGCDFDVILDAEHENHDHDMEYLHGHAHHHDHPHEEGHGHHHDHGHHHHGAGHGHHHEHRGLLDILDIIRQSGMTDRAKKIAEDIFKIIAEAEPWPAAPVPCMKPTSLCLTGNWQA